MYPMAAAPKGGPKGLMESLGSLQAVTAKIQICFFVFLITRGLLTASY